MKILVNGDQPADAARVRYREIGGELRTLNSDNTGRVTFEVDAPTAIWIDKADCLPQFSVVPASELGKKAIERTCKLDGGFPLDVAFKAPDPATTRGITLRLRSLRPDSVEYLGTLAAFEAKSAFGLEEYDAFAHALSTLAQCEGGSNDWARQATTDASGAAHWMIPHMARKATLYVQGGLPLIDCRLVQEGESALALECDEFAALAQIDWNDQGIGSTRPYVRIAALPLKLPVRTRVEVELETLFALRGRFDVVPREGFLAAHSAVELQTTVDSHETAESRDVPVTLLLGKSVLNKQGEFSFSRLPWTNARAVGVYAWAPANMPGTFGAHIFEANVEARRGGASLERKLEASALRSGPRTLDVDFRAQDEKQEPLGITDVLEPGKCFRVAIRPLPVLSPDGSGSWTPSKVQWQIAVPPSERLHLEGLPEEPFFLFVDPLMGDELSHEYEWIPDDQLSDLNGIYMRTYRKGNAPLREKVEIRLRRTKQ